MDEPKTFEDLKLMRETSAGWFDGMIEFENLSDGKEPEPGMVSAREICVYVWRGEIQVSERTHIYDKQTGVGAWSLRVKSRELATFKSMEEFKLSEWWPKVMEKWKDGDTDASWVNSAEIDGEQIETETNYTHFSCEVGNTFRDWLGNHRIGKGHRTFAVTVERSSGQLDFGIDGEEFSVSMAELCEALWMRDELERAGVKVADGRITVPFRHESDEERE